MSPRAPTRYRNFLLGLLGVLILPAFLRQAFPGAGMVGPTIFVILVTRTMLLSRGSRLLRAVLLSAMGALALRGARVSAFLTIQPWGLELALHLLTILGLCFVVYEVLGQVLARGPVDADKLYGAVSAYLLIGLTFASVYEALAFWKPDSFSVSIHAPDQVDALVYFSLVTLSTVGYGDVVPRLPEARVLAAFEAIVGQLYLAVLMARLVGLHLTQSGLEPGSTALDAQDKPPSSEPP